MRLGSLLELDLYVVLMPPPHVFLQVCDLQSHHPHAVSVEGWPCMSTKNVMSITMYQYIGYDVIIPCVIASWIIMYFLNVLYYLIITLQSKQDKEI